MRIEIKHSNFNSESAKARLTLSAKLGIEIASYDFQVALASMLGYQHSNCHLVAEHNLIAEEMLKILNDYEFNFPEKLGIIKFESSILPEGVPGVLNEEEIKHKGEIWVIHKNDKDPLPSNPHAHNKETGYKLHLGNGELFTNKNKSINKRISKKYLLAIRDKVKNIELPTLIVLKD